MRRVSTNERVDINQVRMGVSSLLSREHDHMQDPGGMMQDQLLVQQLMDVTPSSSFDEDEFRDGFIYARQDDFEGEDITPPSSPHNLDLYG
jgi:hypothetical protein